MLITRLFPILALIAALLGYLLPEYITPAKSIIVPLLMLVMLSMGLTLSHQDFIQVKNYKAALLAGLIVQFSVMPLTALAISILFGLSSQLTLGMLLVGSVAGGTASNVITYLANGNVALSVSMTACSTLASVIMTPLLMLLLADSSVDIPAQDMLYSLLKIILLPIGVGVLLNHYARHAVKRIHTALAPFAVLVIVSIIAIVVALNASRLSSISILVLIAPLLHNLTGLLFGYQIARLLKFDSTICRTVAIEVGMQNSGLAAALAIKLFSPMAAIPGAIFSVWLNVTGSIFASFIRKKP